MKRVLFMPRKKARFSSNLGDDECFVCFDLIFFEGEKRKRRGTRKYEKRKFAVLDFDWMSYFLFVFLLISSFLSSI